ncbi:5-formyltetrahydrofolate cyclo-ligase [Bifidobacterium avesanii]|nr:5-formyltetrahydrofolate cyclo-ligase [Bifidobacterium avesanii]
MTEKTTDKTTGQTAGGMTDSAEVTAAKRDLRRVVLRRRKLTSEAGRLAAGERLAAALGASGLLDALIAKRNDVRGVGGMKPNPSAPALVGSHADVLTVARTDVHGGSVDLKQSAHAPAGPHAAPTVAAYVSMDTEIETRPLLRLLLDRHIRVLVPRLGSGLDVGWSELRSLDDLRAPGPHRPAEPMDAPVLDASGALRDADMVILPALAVSTLDGTRLGRGGGWYDRAIAVPGMGAKANETEAPDEAVEPDSAAESDNTAVSDEAGKPDEAGKRDGTAKPDEAAESDTPHESDKSGSGSTAGVAPVRAPWSHIPRLIAVCWPWELTDGPLPHEAHDVPVDAALTPDGITMVGRVSGATRI